MIQDASALTEFDIHPKSMKEAISRALIFEDQKFVQTRWSDALSSVGISSKDVHQKYGNRIVDSKVTTVEQTPAQAFAPIAQIGGRRKWYYANWLWEIRGFLDRLVGGVGLRRGRRDPVDVVVGDAIDFWRVEKIEPNKLLLLKAEMKLPGRAWLQFEVDQKDGKTVVRQSAIFDPLGVSGLLYWYALYPLHAFIFRGMLRNIAKAIKS